MMSSTIFSAYTAMALIGSGLLIFNGEHSHAAFILVMWACIAWGFNSLRTPA